MPFSSKALYAIKGQFILGIQMHTNFEKLVDKISPVLKRITYRLNGHHNHFGHDDLYQEALLHLWLDYNSGKLNNKTDSYILQGCYFHLKNYIRKESPRRKVISIDAFVDEEGRKTFEESLSEKTGSSAPYFDELNGKLIAETIRNNGFTDKEKYILSLFAEGLTTRDIGKRMGTSHVSIVKLMNRLRRECRKYQDFL